MLSYTKADVVSLILCIPANTELLAFQLLNGTVVCVDVFIYSKCGNRGDLRRINEESK